MHHNNNTILFIYLLLLLFIFLNLFRTTTTSSKLVVSFVSTMDLMRANLLPSLISLIKTLLWLMDLLIKLVSFVNKWTSNVYPSLLSKLIFLVASDLPLCPDFSKKLTLKLNGRSLLLPRDWTIKMLERPSVILTDSNSWFSAKRNLLPLISNLLNLKRLPPKNLLPRRNKYTHSIFVFSVTIHIWI